MNRFFPRIFSAVTLCTLSLMAWPAYCAVTTVFINELHYDNTGTDAGEAFEIAGPAGTDLTGWSVVLYNGNGGAVYGTIALSGTIPNQLNGFGFVVFNLAVNGLQNGAPDGLALVDGATLIQFLSYEGTFTGVGGAAAGILSTDIGVSEGGSGAVGNSLQLAGSGTIYEDFTWTGEQANTFGALNTGQTFVAGVETAPSVSSTNPANAATGVAANSNITVSFSEPVDVTGSWFDIGCTISGNHTAAVSGGPSSFSLNPNTDFSYGEACTVTVVAAQVTDQDADDGPDNMAADFVFSFDIVVLSYIHDVQGSGAVSPVVGNPVLIEGIVVGDFQDGVSGTNGDLNGFHVQEEDADADADPATSEGIFVFNGSSPAVNVQIGDLVQVAGAVSEFNGMTEITSFTGVTVVSSGNALPTVSALSLPVLNVSDFEAYEGMYVTFPQALVIAEYFNFDRFNEIVLTSQRHLTPTAEFAPGAAAVAAANAFLLDKITLDDGRTTQNSDPAIHPNGSAFDLTNLFRGGDTVANVTGVVDYSSGLYRIQPTQGADYISVNPRTATPAPVGGSIKVASFNVLNYFSTLDDGVNDVCGPAQNQECRGADNAGEFTRQRDKIIAALTAIDADVVGLLEIENNVNDDAVIDLVNGLNAANGAGTYDYVSTGTIGTDAIKVALIFQPASVSLVGAFAILDSSVDARFIDTKNRPSLAQTFMDNTTGGIFTVAVNHLKSKGSACDDVGDPDLGDGAGNCNLTRTEAAMALADWLATDPTGSGDPDSIIIGDLNSYDKEDPIEALKNAGYTDLVYVFGGESAYSYVFDGQTGYLDYALVSASLFDQVTGATEWHINADESDLIDYDTGFKLPAQDAIYAPDAYRATDHDPVLLGLDLVTPVIVSKMYSDGNPAPVNVLLDCGDATVTAVNPLATPGGEAAVFEVSNIDQATECNASEDPVPTGYTPHYENCSRLTFGGTSPVLCTISNTQDPVTIVASKAYGADGGPAATFAAACDGPNTKVAPAGGSASVGNPLSIVVSDFPWDGTHCNVTEPVPPSGYYETGSSCNGLTIVPSDNDTLCTITNAPTTARFRVTKNFMDGNHETPVDVTLSCVTGLPLVQTQTITESQGVNFVVEDFNHLQLDCSVIEEPLPGYAPTYTASGPSASGNVGGCQFDNVGGGEQNSCQVDNYAIPVDVVIEKVWLIEGSGGDYVDTQYTLTLMCDGVITGGEPCDGYPIGDAADNHISTDWCKDYTSDTDNKWVAKVTPRYPATTCTVVETIYDDAVETDLSECPEMVIKANQGASCLVTNTVFFEGIPTLSQYGLAILALLMLGVGMVGFRRFA